MHGETVKFSRKASFIRFADVPRILYSK